MNVIVLSFLDIMYVHLSLRCYATLFEIGILLSSNHGRLLLQSIPDERDFPRKKPHNLGRKTAQLCQEIAHLELESHAPFNTNLLSNVTHWYVHWKQKMVHRGTQVSINTNLPSNVIHCVFVGS